MSVAIHWFRRDLRLTDNTALTAAVAAHDEVVPVYILSEWNRRHRWTGPVRQEFLCGCLRELAAALEGIGGRLILRQGKDQSAVLERLVQECGASAIYFNRDPDPHGRMMEERIRGMAVRLGIEVHDYKDAGLHERDEVLTGGGTPYKVFGAYARAWGRLEKPTPRGKPRRIKTAKDISSLPLPTLQTWQLTSTAEVLPAGEAAARRRLATFLEDRIYRYHEQRNLPASEGSSRLSQDLRWGLLSIREVYARCTEAAEAGDAAQKRAVAIYLNELAWRDFSFQVLWHFPHVLEREFLPQFRELRWSEPGETYECWTEGQTGFPIVDAGMRQLAATGFMHNRVRMIVAMFLCKDLHCSWKLGERFFLQRLVDGEIASNNAGWQWCASVGTDAQPYFRIQNPWTQTARHDPDGDYIRRWVPELRDLPVTRLTRPPESGKRLAHGYPLPIVDHARERDVALDLYRSAAERFKAGAKS